jgi:hypothetical protein
MGKTKLRKKYEDISERLGGFSLARIQEYYGLMLVLKEFEISNDDYMAWVRFRKIEGLRIAEKPEKPAMSYSCPECKMKLELFEVNSMPCNNVGGDYKSMFSCSDLIGCGYSRYSTDTVEEWMLLVKGIGEYTATSSMIKRTKGCGGCGSK